MLQKSETLHLSNALVRHVRAIYEEDSVPLHRPVFEGNEKRYLNNCIDSNFVSLDSDSSILLNCSKVEGSAINSQHGFEDHR